MKMRDPMRLNIYVKLLPIKLATLNKWKIQSKRKIKYKERILPKKIKKTEIIKKGYLRKLEKMI